MRSIVELCDQTGIGPVKISANPHLFAEDLQEKEGVLVTFKQQTSWAPRLP